MEREKRQGSKGRRDEPRGLTRYCQTERSELGRRRADLRGTLTFSRPKSFASAAEMIGGCWTTTGTGVAGDWLVPNEIHLPMAMLLAQASRPELAGVRAGQRRRRGRGRGRWRRRRGRWWGERARLSAAERGDEQRRPPVALPAPPLPARHAPSRSGNPQLLAFDSTRRTPAPSSAQPPLELADPRLPQTSGPRSIRLPRAAFPAQRPASISAETHVQPFHERAWFLASAIATSLTLSALSLSCLALSELGRSLPLLVRLVAHRAASDGWSSPCRPPMWPIGRLFGPMGPLMAVQCPTRATPVLLTNFRKFKLYVHEPSRLDLF